MAKSCDSRPLQLQMIYLFDHTMNTGRTAKRHVLFYAEATTNQGFGTRFTGTNKTRIMPMYIIPRDTLFRGTNVILTILAYCGKIFIITFKAQGHITFLIRYILMASQSGIAMIATEMFYMVFRTFSSCIFFCKNQFVTGFATWNL